MERSTLLRHGLAQSNVPTRLHNALFQPWEECSRWMSAWEEMGASIRAQRFFLILCLVYCST